MNGARTIALVTGRELRERGLSRSYLISWLIMVLLIGAAFAVPALLDDGDGGPIYKVGLVGTESVEIADAARSILRQTAPSGNIETSSFSSRTEANNALADGQIDVVLIDDTELVLGESTDPELVSILEQGAFSARLESLAASGDASSEVLELMSGRVLEVTAATPETDDDSGTRQFVVGQGILVLLFMAIMITGSWVLLGVTEEKTSRVVEVLLAAVRPWHLIAGKIIGVGILGLLQFGVLAGGIMLGIRVLFGADLIQDLDGGLIFTLLVWFVLGYAVYAIGYAAVGAITSRPEDAQNASLPMTMVAMVGYITGILYVGNHPESFWSQVLSFVPMTAPFVMPVRAVSDSVAVWEHLVAIIITIGFGWGLIRVGGKIYAGGVFKFQSRVKMRDAFRSAEF